MQSDSDADESWKLTLEEKLLIRDLMINEMFCKKNSKTDYQCLQGNDMYKTQSDYYFNSVALDCTENCNDDSLTKENRQKIIKQLVHEFFEQNLKAKAVKDRSFKIKQSYKRNALKKSLKTKALKTVSPKTITKSKLSKSSLQNKLKSANAIIKEAVISRPNNCNVELQNQTTKNETLCVSKDQTVSMETKNNSSSLTEIPNLNLLKDDHENKLKSSIAINKKAAIGLINKPNKSNADLQNQPLKNETSFVSLAQSVSIEDTNNSSSLTEISNLKLSKDGHENKLKLSVAFEKEAAVINNSNKCNIYLQNQPLENEKACVSKAQAVLKLMEDKNSSSSSTEIQKSKLLVQSKENKLKSTIATKETENNSNTNKCEVDLQKQSIECETQHIFNTQTVPMEVSYSSGSVTEIPMAQYLQHRYQNNFQSTIDSNNAPVIGNNVVLQNQQMIPYETPFASEPPVLPMDDEKSPFFIDKEEIDISAYQDGLANSGWNPTQVLYEICSLCKWQAPEFDLVNFVLGKGFLFRVKVNNTFFVAKSRAQTKKLAKHFASSECLAFIGFQFSYKNSQATVPVPSASQIFGPDYTSHGLINRPGGRYNFIEPYAIMPTVSEVCESQVISGDGTGFKVKRYKKIITRQNYLKFPF